MEELSLTDCFETTNRRLYHTINQYGTACLLADKDNARKFLEEIKNSFESLQQLINQIERLENLAYETQEILSIVEE